MDDTPTPTSHRATHAAPATDGVSRRWFLVGGGVLVLVGAATGSVVRIERQHDSGAVTPNPPPAELVSAVARERALIGDLDATTGGSAGVRALLTRARSDHAAHLAALQDLLDGYDTAAPLTAVGGSATVSATTAPSGTARTVAQLRSAETRAADAYAAAAERSSGRLAVVLASMSACEASHAAVLA